jgi:ABC-type glycerol-3-phosphate transport system permease component
MRDRMPRIVLYTTIVAILAIAFFPFWWMIDESFKQPVEIFSGTNLYPHHPTTANYRALFDVYHFGAYLENSILIVAFTVAISLVLGRSRHTAWPASTCASGSTSPRWWWRCSCA